ncbi:MAG: hypothetical protein OXP12_00890, partial [Thaumarchaeota archaeon]|nr:hypothetical protein [Nitrososphaerota archaeon]
MLFIKSRAGGAARNRNAYGIPVAAYSTAEMQAAGTTPRSAAPTVVGAPLEGDRSAIHTLAA